METLATLPASAMFSDQILAHCCCINNPLPTRHQAIQLKCRSLRYDRERDSDRFKKFVRCCCLHLPAFVASTSFLAQWSAFSQSISIGVVIEKLPRARGRLLGGKTRKSLQTLENRVNGCEDSR